MPRQNLTLIWTRLISCFCDLAVNDWIIHFVYEDADNDQMYIYYFTVIYIIKCNCNIMSKDYVVVFINTHAILAK